MEFINYIDNIKITFTGGFAIATICTWIYVITCIFERLYNRISN